MSIADERILEFLNEEGPKTPTKIAEDTRVRFSRPYINTRCKKLASYGLVQELGNGVYAISDTGIEYLSGNLDAGILDADNGKN